eukprot:COSAG01_NODE_1354_length_10598_cov_6.459758_19_plen_84_part_00
MRSGLLDCGSSDRSRYEERLEGVERAGELRASELEGERQDAQLALQEEQAAKAIVETQCREVGHSGTASPPALISWRWPSQRL